MDDLSQWLYVDIKQEWRDNEASHIVKADNRISHSWSIPAGITPLGRKRTNVILCSLFPTLRADLEGHHCQWHWKLPRAQVKSGWTHYPHPAPSRGHQTVQPMPFLSHGRAWILTERTSVMFHSGSAESAVWSPSQQPSLKKGGWALEENSLIWWDISMASYGGNIPMLP